MSASGTQTEFDFDDFDTDVSRNDEDAVIETIAESISRMRDQIDDDDLDGILRSTPAPYKFQSKYTQDQLDPEPFTKARVIEPLLETLGYDDYGYEAGDFSSTRGEQADYAISLRDITSVDSSRLLIEAEPLNKPLEDRGHGLDQVKSWLSQREFESDFGFATDGIRWIFVRYDADSYTHNVIADVNLRPVFQRLHANASTTNDPPTDVVSDEERELVSELVRTFANTNFRSIVDDAQDVIKEKQEAVTDEFYDDYIKYVFGVADGEDERRARSLVGDGVIPPDGADGDDTRLFSVDLMNRLIFIKFLEDKRIVRPDLLRSILDTYEDGVYPQTMYKSFFDPLFYDVLNEKEGERESHIEDIELYSEIPYLNGGLFRPELSNDSDVDERGFNVRDSVLESIIELLERYDFSAEGSPTDIDPSILGSVFEKTINYLTIESGDKNKQLGAYYTPSEITRFCAEKTVRPALLERFKKVLREERSWPEAELDQYETLYDLINGLPGSGALIESILTEMDSFSVCDPSMGSGHFLTSVVEEIVNIRQSVYAQQDSYPSRHRLKKTTIQENIFGVDIMEPAVEIGKLRLWLSIVSELQEEDLDELDVEEIALPNIRFSLQKGNSLIGYIDFPEKTDDGDQTLENWNENSVRTRYDEIISEIRLYHESAAFPEKAESHRQRAEELQRKHRKSLDNDFLSEFQSAVKDATEEDLAQLQPFHWMLEFPKVYAEGGFDVIVGNPPWDMLQPRSDEFFTRYQPDFRSLLPNQKEEKRQDLLEDDEIEHAFNSYNRGFEIRSTYFTDSSDYSLQWGEIDGRTRTGRNELSMLFLERVFELAKEEGYVQQLLPGKIFRSGTCKNLRLHLLDEKSIESAVVFENKGIFENIDNRQTFGILTFKSSGETTEFPAIFMQRDTTVLKEFDDKGVILSRDLLERYSPEAITFPFVKSKSELEVLEQLLRYPNVADEDGWDVTPYIEIYTRDSDYFTESKENADYPVYGGSNLYQYHHDNSILDLKDPKYWSVEESVNPDKSAKRRVREKNLSNLKSEISDRFGGEDSSKSNTQFVDDLLEEKRGEPLNLQDVKLDCTKYRIAFRNITKSTNERTFIASMIPPGIICYHALSTIRPHEFVPDEEDLREDTLQSAYRTTLSDRESFTLLGLLNSIPFDFLMRTKIDVNLSKYKFKYSPLPRLTEDNNWFEHIWTRAAKLNCYGDAFAEMRERLDIEAATSPDERERIQAELDAGAFHAYGLDRKQTKFVLDDFYQVQNPRRITDEYFDLVLKKYDELASA